MDRAPRNEKDARTSRYTQYAVADGTDAHLQTCQAQLLGRNERIAMVDHVHHETTHAHKGKEHKRLAVHLLYTAKLAPALAQKWELRLWERFGHKPVKERELTSRADILSMATPCEHCCEPIEGVETAPAAAAAAAGTHGAPHQEWAACATCHRRYHTGCISLHQGADIATLAAGGALEWQCADCRTLTRARRETMLRECTHHRVEWPSRTQIMPDAIRPADYTTEEGAPAWVEELAAHLRAMRARHEEGAARSRRRRAERTGAAAAAGLTEAERQGIYARPDTDYAKTIGERIRTKVKIHAARSYDPHLDTIATGAYTVGKRTIKEARDGKSAQWVEVTAINAPDGALVATLPPNAAARVRSMWVVNRAGGAAAGGNTAEEEAAALARLATAHLITKGKGGEGALRRPLRHTLQKLARALGCTKERFSDPFTVLPTTTEYWSSTPTDAEFGARLDAYSVLWSGVSLSIPPRDEEGAAAKAVRWSLRSALHAPSPTLTIHLLADGPTSEEYAGYIASYPNHVRRLAVVPVGKHRTQYISTKGNRCHHVSQRAERRGLNIIVVGNPAGMALADAADIQSILKEIGATPTAGGAAALDLPPIHWMPASKARLPRNMRHLPWDTDAPQPLVRTPPPPLAPPPNLARDWTDYAYTDGSYIPKDAGEERGDAPGIGAAVFIPARGVDDGGEYTPQREISIDPRPRRGTEYNIIRAELGVGWG